MICIVIGAVLCCTLWMPMCHNAYLHSLCIFSRFSLMLLCLPIFSSDSSPFLYPRPSLASPSPHRPLHFSPYLQFPSSASLSANLHHTTRRQREGETKIGREGGKEAGREWWWIKRRRDGDGEWAGSNRRRAREWLTEKWARSGGWEGRRMRGETGEGEHNRNKRDRWIDGWKKVFMEERTGGTEGGYATVRVCVCSRTDSKHWRQNGEWQPL